MPRLSDSMEEGTVLRWLKAVGDEVAVGEELVEIETDKANMVYEADTAGTLAEILAQEGDTLPIGRSDRAGGGCLRGGRGSGAGRGRRPGTRTIYRRAGRQWFGWRNVPGHRPRSRPGRHAVSSCFPSPVDRSAGGAAFPSRCWR